MPGSQEVEMSECVQNASHFILIEKEVSQERKTNSGIYEILNTINGKRYIGSAVNFDERWMNHKKMLKKGSHHSIHLQRAWNNHGGSSFAFSVLFECSKDELLKYEQFFIDSGNPQYNICRKAGSTYGVKLSDNTRLKMSESSMGQKFSAETRSRLSASGKGRKFSDESRVKMSIAQSKRKHPPEVLAKLSILNTGEKNANAKLKQSDVDEMRRLHAVEKISCIKISRQFGVCYSATLRIISLKSWVHGQ